MCFTLWCLYSKNLAQKDTRKTFPNDNLHPAHNNELCENKFSFLCLFWTRVYCDFGSASIRYSRLTIWKNEKQRKTEKEIRKNNNNHYLLILLCCKMLQNRFIQKIQLHNTCFLPSESWRASHLHICQAENLQTMCRISHVMCDVLTIVIHEYCSIISDAFMWRMYAIKLNWLKTHNCSHFIHFLLYVSQFTPFFGIRRWVVQGALWSAILDRSKYESGEV